jgi:hypothetical protein
MPIKGPATVDPQLCLQSLPTACKKQQTLPQPFKSCKGLPNLAVCLTELRSSACQSLLSAFLWRTFARQSNESMLSASLWGPSACHSLLSRYLTMTALCLPMLVSALQWWPLSAKACSLPYNDGLCLSKLAPCLTMMASACQSLLPALQWWPLSVKACSLPYNDGLCLSKLAPCLTMMASAYQSLLSASL